MYTCPAYPTHLPICRPAHLSLSLSLSLKPLIFVPSPCNKANPSLIITHSLNIRLFHFFLSLSISFSSMFPSLYISFSSMFPFLYLSHFFLLSICISFLLCFPLSIFLFFVSLCSFLSLSFSFLLVFVFFLSISYVPYHLFIFLYCSVFFLFPSVVGLYVLPKCK